MHSIRCGPALSAPFPPFHLTKSPLMLTLELMSEHKSATLKTLRRYHDSLPARTVAKTSLDNWDDLTDMTSGRPYAYTH